MRFYEVKMFFTWNSGFGSLQKLQSNNLPELEFHIPVIYLVLGATDPDNPTKS